MKEGDTTATSVINEIFAPLSRKRVKELGMGEEEEARYVNRLSHTIEGLNNPASIANGQCNIYDIRSIYLPKDRLFCALYQLPPARCELEPLREGWGVVDDL
jgi:hypothetical protein